LSPLSGKKWIWNFVFFSVVLQMTGGEFSASLINFKDMTMDEIYYNAVELRQKNNKSKE